MTFTEQARNSVHIIGRGSYGGGRPMPVKFAALVMMVAGTSGCAASLPAPPPAAAAAPDEVSVPALQSLLDGYVDSGKMPGIVVAIGRGDAPPTFVAAGAIANDADAPRVGPDSLWRIYSMTKPITAVATMMLVEEGRLELDQPISDFLPAFQAMRVLDAPATSLDNHPAAHAITVRHLLTHTSGLAYQFLGKGPIFDEYKRLGLFGGREKGRDRERQPSTLAEFADRAASVPLLAEPGTEWHYSISSDVLGRVVEAASEIPLDRFVQTRILQPLGMTSTYWTVPAGETARLSTNYAWVEGKMVPIDARSQTEWVKPAKIPYGGSGLVSSARDYDRFLQMLAGEGKAGNVRILKPETVRLSLSNLLPNGVKVSGNSAPDTAKADGFGAGGWVYLADVPEGVRAGTYGWFGAAGTVAFIDVKTRLRVTVMANYFPADKWPVQADVVRVLYSVRNSK
ncbi:serine hydrolase domain-containing protein [Parasphingorhabdus sp.]|uniref:serine hydrolase domain-containing protein n=1 Tax=Parasphingorhabdus sp. TaxID=2709688 RepID=UPI003003101F